MERLLITGASGFIGKFIIDTFREDFLIYGIARRSRTEADIPYHKNLNWIQCDIANENSVKETMNYISECGGVDYVLHLAAFYDFTYKDNPAYDSINVQGTRNLLEYSKGLCRKRFIFASSIAACNFPESGKFITEETKPMANYHYAKSKMQGEELMRDYSNFFPCAVVRFAAVYSDWCEFAPLYKFLTTWLSNKIDSRILAGSGESAIPYIHIRDLTYLIQAIFNNHRNLIHYEIFNATPQGSTSHKELFELATHYYFGEDRKPVYLPKFLAYPGLILKKLLKYIHLTCEEPFERFWMIKYIDKKLNADATYTRKKLNWDVTARYHIKRRLLFLLEKMKQHKDEWKLRNEAALKRIAHRPNLIIYEKMIIGKDAILDDISNDIIKQHDKMFRKYREMEIKEFHCFMSTLYHLLLASVRSNDRSLLLKYVDDVAVRRFAEGFTPETLCNTLNIFNKYIIKYLLDIPEMKKYKMEIYDHVSLSIQISQDEIEDLYDILIKKMPVEHLAKSSIVPDCKELQKMIRQLSAIYQVAPDEKHTFNKEDFL